MPKQSIVTKRPKPSRTSIATTPSRRTRPATAPHPAHHILTFTPTKWDQFISALHPALYTLKGKKPVRCKNSNDWIKWFALHPQQRLVAETKVGPYCVSTTFVGIDYRPEQPPPVLFETVTFAASRNPWIGARPPRYTTWEKAEEGHRLAVRELQSNLRLRREAPTGAVKDQRAKPPRHKRRTKDQRHKATRKRAPAAATQ